MNSIRHLVLSVTYGAILCLRNVTLAWVLLFLPLAGMARAEPITLLALGDSLTAGYGLAEGEGLVPQLQAWLQAQGSEVVVVNAGVSGETTAGGLSRLDWSLTPDVDAVMVLLGGNDLLRGLPPTEARKNLDGILSGISAKGLPVLLIPMQASMNFGPEYKAAFDATYPELAAQYGAVLADPYFAALGTDLSSLGDLMQGDGIHPSKAGVAKIVPVLGPKVQELIKLVK
jgi:acyl-CoA thioesterase I